MDLRPPARDTLEPCRVKAPRRRPDAWRSVVGNVVAAAFFCGGLTFHFVEHDGDHGTAKADLVAPAMAGEVTGSVGCVPAWGPLDERKPSDAIAFDVVRIEPDGSGAIHGKAPAGTVIHAVHACPGAGDVTVGSDGTFSVGVERLPVGRSVIRLRGTLPDGTAAMTLSGMAVTVQPDRKSRPDLAMVY